MARQYKQIKTKNTWIFCEGTKTEKNYFIKMIYTNRIKNTQVKQTTGTSPLSLIKNAISFKESQKIHFKNDDFFCVFDRDGNTTKQLSEATKLAEKNNIKIIFSNPCFEYWILCHFEKCLSPIEIDEICVKLKTHLGNYSKGDSDIYEKTRNYMETAIKNSKEANQKHRKKKIKIIGSESNPSTSMNDIIQHLKSKIH